MNRRQVIRETVKISAGLAFAPVVSKISAADDVSSQVILLRRGSAQPCPIAADFLGFGYEMSSVTTTGLLRVSNRRYVQLVRQLGKQGVLRVGGIVADYTSYQPHGTASTDKHNTVITRSALEGFRDFLNETNWTTIWSLNFAQGTMEQAVTEAKAVASVLGRRLNAFEIGNEVENYSRGDKPFRQPPYTYETYRAEYSRWRAAILQSVPDARFAAPDTASSVEWVERMAKDAHGEVQLLTTHYYRNGQKQGSADQLLDADPKLLDTLQHLRAAAQQSAIPWRLCETNSFYGGGRPGVSDTFVGALWTLDFLLLLAKYGCSGVNLETGVNHLGFISSYSPIQDDGEGNNSAGVPYYGMLAFSAAQAGCSHSVEIELPENAAGLTAYALGVGKEIRSVVVVNRGDQEATISVEALGFKGRRAMRLTAPSLESKTDVLFGGVAVDPGGHWTSARDQKDQEIQGARVAIAKISALVLR